MTATQTPPVDSPPSVRVTWSDRAVVVRDERAFGPAAERCCERFLGRVLSVEGVRSVAIDRSRATVVIRHNVGTRGLGQFLERLAVALREESASGMFPALPRGVHEARRTIHRHGALLSTCAVVSDRPGKVRLRHETLRRDRALAQRVEHFLRTVPGVRRVTLGVWVGELLIGYDPSAIGLPQLVRLTEEALDDPQGWSRALEGPTPTRFGLANATLGIAALADFALPALWPVCAVLLIGTNFRTFRAAWLQVRRRTFGLPTLYTLIVAATLVSGQFVASALMSWFFKFWHDRLRLELAAERLRVLDECLPLPRSARLVRPDGIEVLVPVGRLGAGDRIALGSDEPVPADGLVIEGMAIVNERSVRGQRGASRKRVGDVVLAGSQVLAGSIRVEVIRQGDRTRASSIARALVAATSPAAGPMSPNLRSETFANRAVGPTLATAGLGLLVGDLATVGAILRPDYATGPGMAVPLETLHNAALCTRLGIIVRAPDVFDRLAQVDLIVLEDDPTLSRPELEVIEIQTRLPEADLLRFAASAFRHLADERASALAAACRSRGVHLLKLPPIDFDPGVTVRHGRQRIRVREHGATLDESGPLFVEIDGEAVGWVRFRRSERPAAADALRRIRDLSPVPIALLSPRPEAEAAPLAAQLGAGVHLSNCTPEDSARFLRGCRERGVRTAFVGQCRRHPEAAAAAYLAVSLVGDADVDADPAPVLIPPPRWDLLADLWEIALAHNGQIQIDQKLVMIPNVFCVAGAFLLGFTGLTAVVISNLGTFGLYSRAVGSLRELGPIRRRGIVDAR